MRQLSTTDARTNGLYVHLSRHRPDTYCGRERGRYDGILQSTLSRVGCTFVKTQVTQSLRYRKADEMHPTIYIVAG